MNLFNNIYKNKKVLITGDTGFKGSWLAIWLLELGAEVYGYSLPPVSLQDNYERTKLATRIKHLDGDVREIENMQKYFNQVQPDIAFHLAAQPLVLASYIDPLYNHQTNIIGSVNFFESIRNTPSVKVALNITTDKCYENKEQANGYTETDALGGHDPYSASKACAEIITQSYIKSFFTNDQTCNVASVRAGNVIGGGDWGENRIVPDFFRAYQENTVLKIRNREAIRPWQFVLEPLRGYLHLTQLLLTGGKKFQGPWNFGPVENSYSVNDVIKGFQKKGINTKIEIDETNKKHETQILKLNINKAENLLGWKPVLDFEQTIDFAFKTYKQDLDIKEDLFEYRVKIIKQYLNLL